ncbi:Zinc finger, LIM-type domain and Villin headpiece domain-containing protein [Aphelenchoides bicaudatus]|nr:Zinc finger, LIM-type domain and Villin headpiece domain-containing protein [Aphelenchoides bicaudatus]
MDNEEPIELAHFPGAHEPDPNEVPPIERENFPAPPYTKFEGIEDYPYAIEEMKRRLSSSSVENDSSDEEDYGDQTKVDVEKIKRNVQALEKLDNDSSIAHILRQNIEESKNKNPLKLHWDPRNASRTPSAKKMPHLRFRYDTPINASPSRHLNRPKPWAIWPDGQDHRSATTVIPSFHVPNGTLNSRAATLPEGYYYAGMDGTLNSHYSDHSLNASTLNDSGHVRTGGDIRTNLRTSLPDLNKPVKTYPLDKLQTDNKKLPEDVDRQHLERHLAREDFESLFEMEPIEGCDFSTLYSRSKSHHIHKSCPVCSKPFVAKPYYDNCVSSHPAQQDGYSRALIQRYEDDLKVLKRGKKLFKKVNEHFIDETKNRICYLYFIMEPLTVRPTTLKAFVQAIRYVGKGQGNRIVEHGFCELSRSCQGVIDFITSCRSKGHWNLLNEKGEGVIGDLDDWSVEDDAVFGSHILAEAFKEFTKTPIDKHWRYLLEHVKSISGREIKANLLKKSTLNHRIADNDEFVKIPENVNKDQIKQLFSLIKDGRVDNAMLSQFISSLPSTSNGDAHRKRRQVKEDFVETDEPAIKKKR